MTIIYLINHITSKLFNQVWNLSIERTFVRDWNSISATLLKTSATRILSSISERVKKDKEKIRNCFFYGW